MDATRRMDGEETTVGEPERSAGERSEAKRSEGSPMVERQPSPDSEVRAQPRRRRFTPKYKLEILRKADACTRPGQVGELLRREGLYSSHLVNWRRQRDEGLAPKKRGPQAQVVNPRVKKLEREVHQLERKLKKAEAIIAFQKKVHELLGIPLKPFEDEEDD